MNAAGRGEKASDLARQARAAIDAALAAVDPMSCLPAFLPPLPPQGRAKLIAIGKAAARMTQAIDAHYGLALPGVVLAPYGHGIEKVAQAPRRLVLQAAHPAPDLASLAAAEAIVSALSGLGPQDLVIAAISGGGSALFVKPLPGLNLAEKRAVTQGLLRAGAPIAMVNFLRQRLSAVKGGRLAAIAAPAQVTTLVMSDVPGDDLSLVASGPTIPADLPPRDPQDVLADYGIDASAAIRAALASPLSRPPAADSPCFQRAIARVFARSADALAGAARALQADGFDTQILDIHAQGAAQAVGRAHAAEAIRALATPGRAGKKLAFLSGGELTVDVASDPGIGGPNGEYAYVSALRLTELSRDFGGRFCVAAMDTDGLDGSSKFAGAIIDDGGAARLRIDRDRHGDPLARSDVYSALDRQACALVLGPTGLNVNDLRMVLVEAKPD